MAASTWEGCTLPEEQAAPEETAMPSRSKAMTAVSAFMPATANNVVFGRQHVRGLGGKMALRRCGGRPGLRYQAAGSTFGRQPTRKFRIAPTIDTIRLKFGVHRGSG
jgi:hypothetical protein